MLTMLYCQFYAELSWNFLKFIFFKHLAKTQTKYFSRLEVPVQNHQENHQQSSISIVYLFKADAILF